MQLGAYTVARVLGEGGSGIVYAAHHGATRRDVALKVLRAEAELTPKEVTRFLEEAERMRRVEHPNVTAVLDGGVLPDGRPFIAMPLLHGETLAVRLEKGRLPIDQAFAIFSQLAEGLVAIHQAGLVHRDIKPENVFVTNDTPPRALLLDLGIARELWSAPSTTTQAGRVRGTPAYMAPERFFGKPAGIATDVYELSVVLYLMLTGRLPWNDAADRSQALPPTSAGVVLPGHVSTTLMRALATRPDERPASVKALLLEIQGALSPDLASLVARTTTRALVMPEPTTGKPPPMPPPPRSRIGLFLGIAATFGVLGVGAFELQRVLRAPQPMAIEVPPTSSAPAAIAPTESAAPPATSVEPAPTPSAKPTPKPNAKPSAAPSASAAPIATSDDLVECRKVGDIYCSAEWKRTETSPGQMCTSWQGTLKDWSSKPPEARKALASSCVGLQTTTRQVLAQRKAQLADGGGPPVH